MPSPLILTIFYGVVLIHDVVAVNGLDNFSEYLTPYVFQHGSHMKHREIRDCHKSEYGSLPHEMYQAHQSVNISLPLFKVKRFIKEIPGSSIFSKRIIRGHLVVISDPLKTLSVLEPDQYGGCNLSIRQTVSKTAKRGNCILALNAGYFDTKRGTCYGNVISDGKMARDSKGIQNAHFGLTKNGEIFVGYLSEEELYSLNFKQLVGGVIWILRNGTGFVNDSKRFECEDSQETGTMEQFVSILSARSIVGHDKDGNVILLQVDGKSGADGISLYEMQNLLKEFGLVNAINLDGGGSSTMVIDGITANYPYDLCLDESFSCDRKVSTILCVHEPYCEPNTCNNHGSCSMGKCNCNKNWLQPNCSELFCGQKNCSNHGVCLPEGCICHPGYYGDGCEKVCPNGWFGVACSKQCECMHSESCDPVSGNCNCKPGFTGNFCETECPDGYFGLNCQFKCLCKDSCFCDPITGSCDIFQNSSLFNVTQCLLRNAIQKQNLVKENLSEKRKWFGTIVVLGIITTLCLTSLLLLLFCSCSCRCQNNQVLCSKNSRKKLSKLQLLLPSGDLSDSLSENEIYPLKTLSKN